MKKIVFQNLCNYILDVLPTIPDLSHQEKEEIKQKVRTLALRALSEKGDLFKDFQELPEDDVGRILISRVLTEITKDSSIDVAAKVVSKVMEIFETSPPPLSNLVWDPKNAPWDLAKEGRAKKYEKMGRKIFEQLSFSTLGKKPITQKLLIDTFRDELAARYQAKYKNVFSEGRKGIDFLSKIFEEALEETSEKISNGLIDPERRLNKFYQCYLNKHRNKEHREKITREIFQDLAGEHVKGRGVKTPLNIHDPHIKKLIEEYKSGAWKEKETRELVTAYINDEEDRKFRPILDEIQQLPEFVSIMTNYLTSL